METYKVTSDGCDLQVYARGDKKNQAIIFLHGGPGSGAKAIFELSAFQAFEDTYLCVYFDQRGSGESSYDLRNGLTIPQICNDVEQVVQDTIHRYGCKRIILWGGSFGGALACQYMLHYGNAIDLVVLNNPAVIFERSQGIAFFERMREDSLQHTPESMRPSNTGNTNPEKELEDANFKAFVYSKQNSSNSLRHICAMSSWFFKTSFKEAFERISVPTLLMLGAEDTICENEDTIKAVTSIANSNIELQVLSPCGHAIFEDREEDFVNITKSFLQRKG